MENNTKGVGKVIKRGKAWGWVQLNSRKGGWVWGDVKWTGDTPYIVHGSFYDIVYADSLMRRFEDLFAPPKKNKKSLTKH
jgi:hypothetical protein